MSLEFYVPVIIMLVPPGSIYVKSIGYALNRLYLMRGSRDCFAIRNSIKTVNNAIKDRAIDSNDINEILNLLNSKCYWSPSSEEEVGLEEAILLNDLNETFSVEERANANSGNLRKIKEFRDGLVSHIKKEGQL